MNFQKMTNLVISPGNSKKVVLFVACFLVGSVVIAGLIYEGTKKTVVVYADGEKQETRTHADTVEEVLEELEIPYKPKDQLSPAFHAEVKDRMEIVWVPAQLIVLKIDGKEQEVWTTAKTVSELLMDMDISLSDRDSINVDLDEKLQEGLEIVIDFAFPVIVNDGGEEKEVWTTKISVREFLKKQNIELGDMDRVEPGLDQIVEKDTKIHIVRVDKVVDVVEETIDFAVVSKKDHTLTEGAKKIVQEGKKGRLQKKYEVILENGKEVSRTLISEEVLEEPTDQIVALGTKPKQTVSRGEANSGKEFYVTATAYTASCNGCSGVTATGFNLRANPDAKVIAVDPSVIPLGSKVYVEGYGYAIAADTGGSVKGKRIDVFFASKADAYRWGKRTVKIKILD